MQSSTSTPTAPTAAQAPVAEMVTHLCPSKGWRAIDFAELWKYRELIWFLGLRNVQVRYKQSYLGILWAIIPPLLQMVIFSTLFRLTRTDVSGAIPPAVAIYSGTVVWKLFADVLSLSGTSLTANRNLVTKVYFPRLVMPLSTVLSALIDFCVAFTVLIGLMLWYGIMPTAAVFTLPLFLLLAVATALSAGLWFSALNIRFRDVQYLIPIITQMGMFVTPVIYTTAAVLPDNPVVRAIYSLNPMAGVVEGFRWALLPQAQTPDVWLAVSVGMTVVLLIGGLFYFRKVEAVFADVA